MQRLDGDGNLLDEPDTVAVETVSTVNLPIAVDAADFYQYPSVTYNSTEAIYLIAWPGDVDGGVYLQRYSPITSTAPG